MFLQIKRIKGAISSGKLAAFSGIGIILLGPITRVLDSLVYMFFTQLFSKRNNSIPNCYFLFSTPRSGSTIIYQVLTRASNCKYISNFHVLFPNHASYQVKKAKGLGANYYGYTSSIYDVNEGNLLINRIFSGTASPKEIRKRFFKLLRQIDHTGKFPIFIKNIQNYHNISLLHKAVPEIKFIRIKRDPKQIVQSVLKAYYELGTFHPVTESMRNTSDPVLKSVLQFKEMTEIMNKQTTNIPLTNLVEVGYEVFCEDPMVVLGNEIWSGIKFDDKKVPQLKVSKSQKVSDEELSLIKIHLKDYLRC